MQYFKDSMISINILLAKQPKQIKLFKSSLLPEKITTSFLKLSGCPVN